MSADTVPELDLTELTSDDLARICTIVQAVRDHVVTGDEVGEFTARSAVASGPEALLPLDELMGLIASRRRNLGHAHVNRCPPMPSDGLSWLSSAQSRARKPGL